MAADKKFSWEEIAKHDKLDDCWIVLNGSVYNCTSFLFHHPGGKKAIMQVAGMDGTHAFKSFHKHSAQALLKYGPALRIGVADGPAPKRVVTKGAAEHAARPEVGPNDCQPQPLGPDGQPARHPESIKPPGIVRQVTNGLVGLTFDTAGFFVNTVSNFVVEPLLAAHRMVRPIRGIPKNADGTPTRVAIIGAGCSGLTAAWMMEKTEGFEYQVYEATHLLGGHAYTVPYKAEDGHTINIDMGFIFAGYHTYSNLIEIMKEVGAEPIDSELSTLADVDGFQYASDSAGICSEKKPVWMHKDGQGECQRFQDLCTRFYGNPMWNLIPFHVFLDLFGFSQEFRTLYLKPTLVLLFIGEEMVFNMPSRLIFNMFAGDNKQADLMKGYPCFTIKGGTNDWLQKLVTKLRPGAVKLKTPVRQVRRVKDLNGREQVLVITDEKTEVYDHVLFSCGAKAAALCLQDKNTLEDYIFSQIRYENGAVMVLHKDQSFITQFGDPKNNRNFNYRSKAGMPQCEVSGYMHQISQQQGEQKEGVLNPVLTFNPLRQVQGEIIHEKYCVIHEEDLWHLVVTRALLPMVQGRGNVWYGATWTNWIGHASGIDAGMAIATRLGAVYPIQSKVARDTYFDMACRDMLGHRFDWRTAVRQQKPVIRAAL